MALVEKSGLPWHVVASLVEAAGGALVMLRDDTEFADPVDTETSRSARARVSEADVDRWESSLRSLLDHQSDIRLLTILDVEYPENLRLVFNRPPFLFIRGSLLSADNRAVAVVGTRDASEAGVAEARALARGLVRGGVTVLSGLARGIDAAAHAAALEERGRTVAVMGTGISRIYPREHEELAMRIVDAGGALISQFYPDSPPLAANFPRRNVVMSGMAIGTAVIEASSTSGAKMQARLALEHGKRLFLVQSLVMNQDWAKRYATRPGANVVSESEDVLRILSIASSAAAGQLRLV